MFLSIFAFLLAYFPQSMQVVINEVMQSNIDCLFAEQDFPDSWVEIYNPSADTISLYKWRLGDQYDFGQAYVLATKKAVVAPQGHLLIYCDKVGTELHTDFRLESKDRGSLYLWNRQGTLIDSLSYRKMPAPNLAYGREEDGGEIWGYQLIATPGSANMGGITDRHQLLGEPVFSLPGCVLETADTLTLHISVPDDVPAGTRLLYTTDGSEPTPADTLHNISDSIELTLTGSTIVRACLYHPDWLSPRSTVHSYLFLGREMTLPLVSLTTDSAYLYSDSIGILVRGTYDDIKPNYKYKWRRPMQFELFEYPDEPAALNQLCEGRVQGNTSRDRILKSLAIYAHKRFGEKRLDYEFFPTDWPAQTDYKSIVLRNAGSDFFGLYLRDALTQRVMGKHVDLDWQGWRPCILYINGEYKGMLNIRERSNDDYIFTHYDHLEDIDMVEIWQYATMGDMDEFNAFRDFYNEPGHTWEEYEQWMDCSEYVDFMIMNMYFDNKDFPGANCVQWRPRSEGARWRWLVKDVDGGLGLIKSDPTYDYLAYMYGAYDKDFYWGNPDRATRLFRSTMADSTFQRIFVDRLAVYMGDFLNHDGVMAVLDSMMNVIGTEYEYHRLANGISSNAQPWAYKLLDTKWLDGRKEFVYQNLQEFFGLGEATPLQINCSLSDERLQTLRLTLNGIPLSRARFDGKYFRDRPLTLSVSDLSNEVHDAALRFAMILPDSSYTVYTIPVLSLTLALPECLAMSVDVVFTDDEAISTIYCDPEPIPEGPAKPYDHYDLFGRPLKHPQDGNPWVIRQEMPAYIRR